MSEPGVEPATDPPSALERLPGAALAAVGAGLGGLSFFTVVGGAITVARLRGAGFSGTKAVAVVPRSDLLATGAEALLLPIIVASALLVPFALVVRGGFWRQAALAIGFTIAAVGGLITLATLRAISHWSVEMWKAAAALVVIAAAGGYMAETTAARIESRPDHSRASAVMLLFLVIALFAGTLGYALAYARPVVHAAAILGPNAQEGLTGIFIGESSSGVWIGRKGGAIIEVPRSRVCALAVGPSTSPNLVDRDAQRLLLGLRATEPGLRSPTATAGCGA